MKSIIIYVTHKNLKEAKKIGSYLLQKGLIACANYFPIESASRWTGKIVTVKEAVSVLKTSKKNWHKVEKEIEKIHPYKVPCIMKIEVEANKSYAKWIQKETI